MQRFSRLADWWKSAEPSEDLLVFGGIVLVGIGVALYDTKSGLIVTGILLIVLGRPLWKWVK